MPDFQRALTAESAQRIETSPYGEREAKGGSHRARSLRRTSAGGIYRTNAVSRDVAFSGH
ncbi:MAG: hypothetical protein BGO12_22815 [Verrucomicrobia bacterium 61-8]|nr:MAG: hypothetical protein BGO12_22815 [Verrucomicrobia bacterium 61-8]